MASTKDEKAVRRVPVRVGDPVQVTTGHAEGKMGTIRFIGNTKFATGKWLGVEMEEPVGKNDGSVQGETYFSCKQHHGLFVKPSMVKPVKKKTPTSKGTPKPSHKSTASSSIPQRVPPASDDQAIAAKQEALEKLRAKKEQLAGAKDDSTGVMAAAAAAAAAADKEQQKADRMEAKAQEVAGLTAVKELTRVKSELTATKEKLKKVQTNLMELKKAEVAATQKATQASEKLEQLQNVVEDLSLEKDIAEQTTEELKDELELLKDQLKNAQLEAEMVKQKSESAAQDMMKDLPSDQQEVAKLVQQNKSLTDALRQIRDLAMSEKNRFEMYQEQSKRTIAKLQEESQRLKEISKLYEQAKTDVEDLKSQLDEAQEHEDAIEHLTERNTALEDEVQALKVQISTLEELQAAADEMEDGHKDYEEQLQQEVDVLQQDNNELQEQLKVSQVRIGDLQRSVKQFRALTQELKAQMDAGGRADGAGGDGGGSGSSKAALSRQIKLSQQLSEFRSESVQHALFKLDAEQATQRVNFIQAYIPDNMKIDHRSLTMLSMLERLTFKAELTISLLDKYYGPEVAVLEGNDAGKTSLFSCQVSQHLIEFKSAVQTLQMCLRTADSSNYDAVATRWRTLEPAEKTLDEFLALIGNDKVTEVTPVKPIIDALGIIRSFKQTFFALPDKEAPSDALPRAETAASVHFSCRRMFYQQQSARVQFLVLGALVLSVERPGDETEDADSVPKHHQLFSQLEDGQIKSQSAVAACCAQAAQLETNGGYVFLQELDASIKECDELSTKCSKAVSLLLLKARAAATSGDAAEELEKMLEEATAAESAVASSYALLNERLKLLNEHLVERLKVASKAPVEERKGQEGMTVWERHAQETRQQLTEAAGVKDKLDESSALIQAKADELFKANRKAREAQAQIAVMSQKLKVVQDEAGKAEALKSSLESIKRESQEYEEEAKKAHADLGKYTRENQALKKKLATVTKKQIDVKRGSVAVTGSAMTYASADSAGEVDLLARTVRTLRQQLSTSQASKTITEFHGDLPPLPSLKATRVHPVSHHTRGENMSVTIHREQLPAGTAVVDKMSKLSKDISKVATTLLTIRSAPILVDLSSPDQATEGRSRYAQQAARRQKLSADVLKLNKKLTQLGKLAAHDSSGARPKMAIVPERASQIGEITIPIASKAAVTGDIAVGRSELHRITSTFV